MENLWIWSWKMHGKLIFHRRVSIKYQSIKRVGSQVDDTGAGPSSVTQATCLQSPWGFFNALIFLSCKSLFWDKGPLISFSTDLCQLCGWSCRLVEGQFVVWPLQFSSSVLPTLCDPMDCCMPGLPVHHHLLEFIQIHVHWIGDAIQPSHSLLSPSPPTFNLSQHQSLQMSQLFPSGGQSIGVSASASVLPVYIQDWFSLGWTGWISLQSKGLSRVFSNTTVQKHQFFGAQLSL